MNQKTAHIQDHSINQSTQHTYMYIAHLKTRRPIHHDVPSINQHTSSID